VITIPDQRLLALAGKNTAMKDAFGLADEVLFNAVRGISDLITIHGLINLDFADVRTIMNEMGVALMGTGTASGDERAVEAARAAISSPLLEDLSIDGAHGVLINITGSSDLTLFEVNEASTLIQEAAHEDVNIIFGAVIDETMPEGEMRVTVIATGLDHQRVRRTIGDELPAGVHHNVTPLRPEPAPMPSPAPAAEVVAPPSRAETAEPSLELESSDDPGFMSPYDDEKYDVPAFLRARNKAENEDDAEEPTFLRRSAD
jgi:cell division protein FtsZ